MGNTRGPTGNCSSVLEGFAILGGRREKHIHRVTRGQHKDNREGSGQAWGGGDGAVCTCGRVRFEELNMVSQQPLSNLTEVAKQQPSHTYNSLGTQGGMALLFAF